MNFLKIGYREPIFIFKENSINIFNRNYIRNYTAFIFAVFFYCVRMYHYSCSALRKVIANNIPIIVF